MARPALRWSRRYRLLITATFTLLVLQPSGILAHDMPSDVLVQMLVRPSDHELQVLVRLPLISLLNINLPKRGEDFLDLAAIEPSLRDAATATAEAVDFFEGSTRLGTPRIGDVRVSLPSDTSFTSWDSAIAHVHGPRLPVDTEVVWNQGFFDAELVYDVPSAAPAFSLHPYFTALAPRVVSSVRFFVPTGAVRSFELTNDPGLVHLDPAWYQAMWTFIQAGFLHVVRGGEYLLFLVALAMPIRRIRLLRPVVAAFTVSSSATLIAAAFQVAPAGGWFAPAIAALTAIGIVAMTIDNVFVADHGHRWTLALGFGLAFGFALSFTLRQSLQFAGEHFFVSVLSFAVGAGLAVLFALAIIVPGLTALFRMATSERVGGIVVSALVCHTAWHWMVGRVAFLTAINWPPGDVVEVMRWGTAAALIAAAAVFLVGVGRRFREIRRGTFDAAANDERAHHLPGVG